MSSSNPSTRLFQLSGVRRERWTGLVGASQAYAISSAFADTASTVLVVCPNDEIAERLAEDLAFFDRRGSGSEHRHVLYPARRTVRKYAQLEDATVVGQRLAVLQAILDRKDRLRIFCGIEGLSQWTVPREDMGRASGILLKGETYERDRIVRELIRAGYEQDAQTLEPGTFSVRGSILDVFSPNHPRPMRVEFFGDEVESLRGFDPETQRSQEAVDEWVWVPSKEALIDPDRLPSIEEKMKILCDDRGIAPSARLDWIESLKDGRMSAATQALLPLFYPKPESLLDYLPADTRIVRVDPFLLGNQRRELAEEYARVEEDQRRNKALACSPADHVVPDAEIDARLDAFPTLEIADAAIDEPGTHERSFAIEVHEGLRQALAHHRKKDAPLAPVVERMRGFLDAGMRIAIVAHSESGEQRLSKLLSPHFPAMRTVPPSERIEFAQSSSVVLTHGALSFGFVLRDERLVYLTEADLFGLRKAVAAPKDEKSGLTDLNELSPGDFVVHLDHGVGLYRGLERIKVNRTEGDFLLIEYAEKDKLFLPIYRLNRVHKYVGADGRTPALDRLGNPHSWEKARARAKKAVEEMAQELLRLYAQRQVAQRKPFSPPDTEYLAFEEDFPFEETRDQLRAIDDVASDLESEKPMDRLVCGDVGFGKTEVALRAAFRTAMEGLQTAVLVPTTVLAQQHYETFKRRMEKYPIRVDFVSRFKEPKEQKEVIEQLKAGKLDVVVGTHRLLSKDVAFANLGLLVLDEEHRFGVKHKEAIKKYRNLVNVLTLTATPIPRTLQLSMTGIRDLSVINTPPLDRKSVETVLCRFEDDVIRTVIEKELARGGQVFFVHNRVETIDAMATHIHRLVPKARIGVGHAQMDEGKLEETMMKFLRRETDVLLCTTIIESGLDIPNANTIMINRADCFGLAQLYQLRGRVGRSDRSAYCYLLIPGEDLIGKDAMKRLKALKRFTELGSGLKIAMHDLEIRGAGNLLGSMQSGHIADVGFELYSDLLEREIRKLKGEKNEEEIEPEIQTAMPAFFPESYVPDAKERLVLYKRLSAAKTDPELEQLRAEIRDRFGNLPPTAENLMEVISLKILARNLGIVSLRLAGDAPLIEFSDRAKIDIDKLLRMVKRDKRMTLRPDQKLSLQIPTDYDMVAETRKILENLRIEPHGDMKTA